MGALTWAVEIVVKRKKDKNRAPVNLVFLRKFLICIIIPLWVGLPGFSQQASIYALKHEGDAVVEMREIYRRRRDLLLTKLGSIAELRSLKPDAGMFLMVDVRDTGLEASEFVQQLYQYAGVSVLDATAFGASAKGFVRISYTIGESELEEACRRIGRFVESLRPISRLA